MESQYALGIDIGGTNSAFGLVDKKGNIEYENSFPTTDFILPEDLVSAIFEDLKEKNLLDSIIGISIGAPNGNHFTGNIEYAPNLSWKGIVPLTDLLHKSLKVPCKLTNDAKAAGRRPSKDAVSDKRPAA